MTDEPNTFLMFKRIPKDLIIQFKMKCVSEGKKQKQVIMELMTHYVKGTTWAARTLLCKHRYKGGVCVKCYKRKA